MIEELEPEKFSPAFIKRKPRKRDIGSCSRKLDLNQPVYEGLLVTQSHIIDIDESIT